MTRLRFASPRQGVGFGREGLGDLGADAHDGIEGLHRVLEDVRDRGASGDFAGDLGAVDKSADREGGERLSAAGLADERDASVRRNRERDVAHGNGEPPLRAERDAKMADVEDHQRTSLMQSMSGVQSPSLKMRTSWTPAESSTSSEAVSRVPTVFLTLNLFFVPPLIFT